MLYRCPAGCNGIAQVIGNHTTNPGDCLDENDIHVECQKCGMTYVGEPSDFEPAEDVPVQEPDCGGG